MAQRGKRHPPRTWKLRKGDRVVVVAGGSKGVSGKIERVDRLTGGVIVSGVNLAKKHTRPTQDKPGGIVDKLMPVHLSNLAMVDPQKGGATKVGYRIEDGRKIRYAKKSGAIL